MFGFRRRNGNLIVTHLSIPLDSLCLLKVHIIISLLIALFINMLDIIYIVLMSLMAFS